MSLAFYLGDVTWDQPSNSSEPNSLSPGRYWDGSNEETQEGTPKEVLLLDVERVGVRWLWGGVRAAPQAKVNPERKQGAVNSNSPSGLGKYL